MHSGKLMSNGRPYYGLITKMF